MDKEFQSCQLLTVELVDQQIAEAEQQEGQPRYATEVNTLQSTFLDNIDQIYSGYRRVRPILNFVVPLLFFKPDWQNAIRTLLTALDAAMGYNA